MTATVTTTVTANHFDPGAPDWNRIEPLAVATSAAEPICVLADGRAQLAVCDRPDCEPIALEISFHDIGIRIRSQVSGPPGQSYGMLDAEPPTLPCTIEPGPETTADTTANSTILHAGPFTLQIGHKPLSFHLLRDGQTVQQSATDGHFVRRHRLPPLARVEGGWLLCLELDIDEPVYGLGEKWARLDRRGQLVRSYNSDALGVNAERSYKNTPFAWSPTGWGAFVHTPAPVTHGVGYAPWSHRAYVLFVEDPDLDCFLLAADNPAQMLARYTQLTGRAPTPPDWSMGVILSKAYYRDADELLSTARAVRARHMPCDVITLDGRAWQDTDTRFAFEWDPSRYPDPRAVLDELKALDFKICVWEYPLISVKNPLFAQLAERGWLLRDRRTGEAYRYEWDMSPFGEVLTPLPESGIVDFTHPDAYRYWCERHRDLFAVGVDMIKADFGEQVEELHIVAHTGESGTRLHNVYSLLYNRCVYEAAEAYSQNGPFLFSRAAWIGSQRYPSQWGGDPQADWHGLAASLRASLSWGLSGGPFYATDVGGFYRDTRDDELYVRWAQAAVFAAHIRFHGIGPREPWSYGPDAEQAVFAALRLRYRLLAYLRATLRAASATGIPVQRAMVLAFPDDPVARTFEHQFMFGPAMLIAPCLGPDGHVRCYLPAGEWLRFPDQQPFAGGQCHVLTLALDEMAIFVRRGERIPLCRPAEHTGQLADQLADIESVEQWWP